MPATNRSTLSSFDADGALEAAKAAVSGPLYSFCEYDSAAFRPLYVDDRTIAMYESKEQMLEHFEQIHTHVHMDFMQINLFRNTLFPAAERVDYIVTAMDILKIVRIYIDEEGIFLAIDPGEPVEPVVSAIATALGREFDRTKNQNH